MLQGLGGLGLMALTPAKGLGARLLTGGALATEAGDAQASPLTALMNLLRSKGISYGKGDPTVGLRG